MLHIINIIHSVINKINEEYIYHFLLLYPLPQIKFNYNISLIKEINILRVHVQTCYSSYIK